MASVSIAPVQRQKKIQPLIVRNHALDQRRGDVQS
jgi:hypothetical protein